MSISALIERVCVQDAVYWKYMGPDGMGGVEFEEPIEIKVRWDESTEIVSAQEGREYVSEAQLLCPQNLLEQSYIYMGSLFEVPLKDDPLEINKAYEIKAMDRHPLFAGTEMIVFIAYL